MRPTYVVYRVRRRDGVKVHKREKVMCALSLSLTSLFPVCRDFVGPRANDAATFIPERSDVQAGLFCGRAILVVQPRYVRALRRRASLDKRKEGSS